MGRQLKLALVAICLALSYSSIGSFTRSNILMGRTINTESERTADARKRVSITSRVHDLQSASIRFCMYNDERINQTRRLSNPQQPYYSRYGAEADFEALILENLSESTLKIENCTKADIIVISTPITKVALTHRGGSLDEAFNAVLGQPLFRRYHGHRHVLISLALVTYSFPHKSYTPLNRWYKKIKNVTAALGCDPAAVYAAYKRGHFRGSDYERPFASTIPLSHTSFSIGIGESSSDFPIVEATFDKYMASKFSIFYHTRVSESMFNSTQFRHAPLLSLSQTLNEAQPPRSIGTGLDRETWLHAYTHSKFCLCIRGDNPQSHSLIRSIRAGCIPVIVSDLWPTYAPLFKSTLKMSDYCLFLKERDFLADPELSVQKLFMIKEERIKEIIAELRFAQQIVLPDHPDSLFAHAFVREATTAMAMTDRENITLDETKQAQYL